MATAPSLHPNVPAAPARTNKLTMPGNKNAAVLRILLEENPDIPPGGQFIGHNGNSYMLKPGSWCDVPVPILEILDHAVTSVPVVDEQTKQIIGYREKLRYPYRVAPGQIDPRALLEDAAVA